MDLTTVSTGYTGNTTSLNCLNYMKT